MTEDMRFGRKETNLTAMPPPRGYPAIKRDEGPAHARDDASTGRMIVVKKVAEWGQRFGDGVDDRLTRFAECKKEP